MNGRGFITISMHQLERVKIIEAVVQRRLTVVLAAARLQLCERQVSRLVRRYEAAGPALGDRSGGGDRQQAAGTHVADGTDHPGAA
jgi:Helix-turn-helix domain